MVGRLKGQVWKVTMCAAHYKLDYLCVIVDFNVLHSNGDITKVMNPTAIDKKFETFHSIGRFQINWYDFK